ncbi:glycosyltransferase family 8 protein [Oscillibacter sp.]|uniref:glycosyltransferase family 8 protein n=1 Tax=Oscillibacter sp. TaxID=1945593 RepID=UPI002896601A|nr:glycosyltransferase family 8 protein [Oscillibacter sp.]
MEEARSPFYSLNQFEEELSGKTSPCTHLPPVFGKDSVAVSLVSSEEYAPFAAVVVASILANATSEHTYDIVVLTNDMRWRSRKRMEAMGDGKENISIRVLDISKMIEGFSFYTWAHFTSNTYYRLLTPDVFTEYTKVVYLDSDVVVNHDLAELFETDLTGYYMAAAYDTHVISYCTRTPPLEQRAYNSQELGMENPEEYFQAGVSLFNLTALRRDFEPGYLIQQGMIHKLRWLDQDLVNKLFYGKILRLSGKWNVMVSNQPEDLDEYHLPDALRQDYFENRQTPYIVHYVGRAMPCYTVEPDLFEYFWHYARMTPFYEILIQRMAVDYADKRAEHLRDDLLRQLGREPFVQRLKRRIKAIADRLLPKGSKARIYVKRVVFQFYKWN